MRRENGGLPDCYYSPRTVLFLTLWTDVQGEVRIPPTECCPSTVVCVNKMLVLECTYETSRDELSTILNGLSILTWFPHIEVFTEIEWADK